MSSDNFDFIGADGAEWGNLGMSEWMNTPMSSRLLRRLKIKQSPAGDYTEYGQIVEDDTYFPEPIDRLLDMLDFNDKQIAELEEFKRTHFLDGVCGCDDCMAEMDRKNDEHRRGVTDG